MKRFAPLVVALSALPLLATTPANEGTATTVRSAGTPAHTIDDGAPKRAGRRVALIIGITDYIHFDDEDGGDLPGAEGDARGYRDVLVSRHGFAPENVRMLLSREATRAAIEEALTEWAPSQLAEGDHFTFVFAGHGSQVWDEDGDESDGLDETIAPADVRADDPSADVTDDQLREWLGALPTRNVLVILDNCNSGTGTRAATPFARTRQLGRDLESLARPDGLTRRALPGQVDETMMELSGATVLELSAAQPYQAAVDAYFPGDEGEEAFHGGAFSTFLIRELWKAPAGATYQEVFDAATTALARHRFEQDPFISEDVERKDAPLFAIEGEVPSPAAGLPVTEVRDGQVSFLGGRTLGLTPGSLLQNGDGARIRVERVGANRSTGRLLVGEVAAGDMIELAAFRFLPDPLTVQIGGVDSEAAQTLKSAFSGDDRVVLVQDEDAFSDMIVRRRADRLRVVAADGAIRHEVTLGMGGVESLIAALRNESAAKRLGELENPAADFGLRVSLAGGGSGLGVGESVVFEATAERDGYLTLVDLGTDGSVTVLFPNAYDPDSRVRAGQTVRFPSEAMDSEILAQPPSGRGMVMAFLTSRPLELDELADSDFAGGDWRYADRVAEAVKSAAGTHPSAPEAVRLDGWTSASLVYEIER